MPIQLGPADAITVTKNNAVVDTQDAVAAFTCHLDLNGGTVQIGFVVGTPASNSFTPSQRGSSLSSLAINLGTGVWQANGQSGTLSPQQIGVMQANLKGFRNNIETLATALGLFSGSVVQWT